MQRRLLVGIVAVASSLWLSGGGVVLDEQGRAVLCEDCPCDDAPPPPTTTTCNECPDGVAAAQYEVTFSGIANSGCGECGGLNGSVVLSQEVIECFWSGEPSPRVFCGGNAASVYFTWDSGLLKWSVVLQFGGIPVARWEASGAGWDCLSSLTLTRTLPAGTGADSLGHCQSYPATVTIGPAP